MNWTLLGHGLQVAHYSCSSHYSVKLCFLNNGWVRVPKRMKVPKGGRVILNPKVYIAGFGALFRAGFFYPVMQGSLLLLNFELYIKKQFEVTVNVVLEKDT